jgi:hypothetical protein
MYRKETFLSSQRRTRALAAGAPLPLPSVTTRTAPQLAQQQPGARRREPHTAAEPRGARATELSCAVKKILNYP